MRETYRNIDKKHIGNLCETYVSIASVCFKIVIGNFQKHNISRIKINYKKS